MNLDFGDFTPSDPTAELPQEPLGRAMALRNGLVSLCEGRGNMEDAVYCLLRREFMNDPAVSSLVPRFVRAAQDTGAMWAYLKDYSGQWEPRRQFVRNEFAPLIDRLERGATFAETVISDGIATFDAEAITGAWNKALARREDDPEGAITAARTLLESVCKHVLQDAEGHPTYGPNDDLPKLCRQVTELLNIAPSQHSEEAFKRILGGATSVVEGLGTLRNKLGDSHAPEGRKKVRVAPRHATLVVTMAGSMALFLIDTANAKSKP